MSDIGAGSCQRPLATVNLTRGINTKEDGAIQMQASNDLLRELRDVVQNFQVALDALSQKAVQGDDVSFPKGKDTCIETEPPSTSEAVTETQSGSEAKIEAVKAWLAPEKIKRFLDRCAKHERECAKLHEEMGHLIRHYRNVGGDEDTIEAAESIQEIIYVPLQTIRKYLTSEPDEREKLAAEVKDCFLCVHVYAADLYGSLHKRKHAFYFRKIMQWDNCLYSGIEKVSVMYYDERFFEALDYIHDEFFDALEALMADVPEELKTFRDKILPSLLAEEKERDTTQYANTTAIATFFSSVTATTLQFSYMQAGSALGGIVNLFWFLSLVFSVSSAVSSLLGMTWRKSSIYHSSPPPKPIRMWLDNAPMAFLVISAVAFIIGLNLFAYLSHQPRYVSLSTNILTGAHGSCILAATAWFVYRLKHESKWAHRFRASLLWITDPYRRLDNQPSFQHLRRNFHWAFGNDKRVADLNFRIDPYEVRVYPGPHLLSRKIRHSRASIKKFCAQIKNLLSIPGNFLLGIICCSPSRLRRCLRRCKFRDIETGESFVMEPPKLPPQIAADQAVMMYIYAVQKTIGDTYLPVMECRIKAWESADDWGGDGWLRRCLDRMLWGYPELVEMFFDEVEPVLAPLREQNAEIKKKAEEELRKRKGGGDHLDAHCDAVKSSADMLSAPDSVTVPTKASPSTGIEGKEPEGLVQAAETHVERRRVYTHGPMKRLRNMARHLRRSVPKHWPSREYRWYKEAAEAKT